MMANDPAILALISGFSFTSYTLTTSTPIQLHYSPNLGPLGSPTYSSPLSSPPHTIPINSLTDVYLDNCLPEFCTPLTANCPASHCCSLRLGKLMLHLKAESAEERIAFLDGLRLIVQSCGAKNNDLQQRPVVSRDASNATGLFTLPSRAVELVLSMLDFIPLMEYRAISRHSSHLCEKAVLRWMRENFTEEAMQRRHYQLVEDNKRRWQVMPMTREHYTPSTVLPSQLLRRA